METATIGRPGDLSRLLICVRHIRFCAGHICTHATLHPRGPPAEAEKKQTKYFMLFTQIVCTRSIFKSAWASRQSLRSPLCCLRVSPRQTHRDVTQTAICHTRFPFGNSNRCSRGLWIARSALRVEIRCLSQSSKLFVSRSRVNCSTLWDELLPFITFHSESYEYTSTVLRSKS